MMTEGAKWEGEGSVAMMRETQFSALGKGIIIVTEGLQLHLHLNQPSQFQYGFLRKDKDQRNSVMLLGLTVRTPRIGTDSDSCSNSWSGWC